MIWNCACENSTTTNANVGNGIVLDQTLQSGDEFMTRGGWSGILDPLLTHLENARHVENVGVQQYFEHSGNTAHETEATCLNLNRLSMPPALAPMIEESLKVSL